MRPSGTTSYGPTSRGTPLFPNACTRSASAGSGDRVLGAADVTRNPGIRSIRAPATHAALAALAALAVTSLACAESAFAPTPMDGDAGSATAIAHWQIQS